MEIWDLAILGAGPAGLTASLYGARSGLSTIVIEEKTSGGLMLEVPIVENYPGVARMTGIELAGRMNEQAREAGAEIHEIEKAQFMNLSEHITLKTDRGDYISRSLVIATGAGHRKLDAPGVERLTGRGISSCALCDGAFFKGKKVAVVGGGNSAATSALYLANVASKVFLIHRRDTLRAEKAWVESLKREGVEFVLNKVVVEAKGESRLSSLLLRDTRSEETSALEVDGLFVEIGQIPNSEVARAAGARIDSDGYIIVDTNQATNLRGVYAAGDVTDSFVKQISSAVGEGAIASTQAFVHVKRPYYMRTEKP